MFRKKPYLCINVFLIIGFFVVLPGSVYSQLSVPGLPESFNLKTKGAIHIPAILLHKIDTTRLSEEDKKEGITNRYGIIQDTVIDIKLNGIKTIIYGKGTIWQYKLEAPSAYSIGIFFRNYILPEGANVFVYNENHSRVTGAFTQLNNKPDHHLTLADFKGKNAIIEYFEPENPSFSGELIIGAVSQAYKNIETVLQDRIGINCPQGDNWQDVKHAVCKITFWDELYTYKCSGALINNQREDGTPYFLTANHCLNSDDLANTVITYFNYENSLCDNSDANSTQTLSGATLKSTNSYSDFTLLELSETPPQNYDAYYAGWNTGTANLTNSTSIHHPEGSPKCISLDKEAPVSYNGIISWDDNSYTSANSHWEVKFDEGITEGGSSGAPLFDQNKRIIGQLHGGDDISSFYGKFSLSWNRSNLSQANLKSWLNPENVNITSLEGRYFKIKPVSNFSTMLANVCINNPVVFEDNSIYSPDTWEWIIDPSSYDFVNSTTKFSQNPMVIFKEERIYSVTLIASNSSGSDTLVRKDYINAGKDISVNLTAQKPDSCFCGWEFNRIPLIVSGAASYTYQIEPDDKINYTTNVDTLFLSLISNYNTFGNFDANVKVNGTFGSCSASDSVQFKIIIPLNDNIKNSIELWPGNNGPFSNQCASAESKEPTPPSFDCYSNMSWCPDFTDGLTTLNNTIWFTFTGPSSEKITIETRNINSRIAVYKADSYNDILSGNTSLYEIIAANDDRSITDMSSFLENITVVHGEKYWVQMDGSKNDTGTFSIRLLGSSLEVFPNPTSGIFTLIVSSLEEEIVEIQIYSDLGKRIFNNSYFISHDKNRLNLDLSWLPTGIYIINATTISETINAKVFILK